MKHLCKYTQYILAFLLFAGILLYAMIFTTDDPKYHLFLDEWARLLRGMGSTLLISLVALVLSMLLGFVLYLMLKSHIPFVKSTAVIFREMMMGTPLLVMVFITVYVFGRIVMVENKMVLGIAALTLYMSPYLAGAYQTAVAVVDRDQYTVMELYHFTGFQKYRYVIFPQMLRPLLPSLINNLSSTVKGSALLKVVSVSELSYVLSVISQKTWASVEGYLLMWLGYLIITVPLSLLAQWAGRRMGA